MSRNAAGCGHGSDAVGARPRHNSAACHESGRREKTTGARPRRSFAEWRPRRPLAARCGHECRDGSAATELQGGGGAMGVRRRAGFDPACPTQAPTCRRVPRRAVAPRAGRHRSRAPRVRTFPPIRPPPPGMAPGARTGDRARCGRSARTGSRYLSDVGVSRSTLPSNCQRGFGTSPVEVRIWKKPLTWVGPSPSATYRPSGVTSS